jgi:hypothetical protein
MNIKILNADVLINEEGLSSWIVKGTPFGFNNVKLSKEVQKAFLSLADGYFSDYENMKAAILISEEYTEEEKGLFFTLDERIR